MRFAVEILGCQYNYYDAKNITHLLTKMGYIYVNSPRDADIVFILSCSVRQKPVDKIIGKIESLRKQNIKIKTIVTGCVLEEDKKRISDKNGIFVDPDDIMKYIGSNIKNIKSVKSLNEYYFAPADTDPETAFVPIMQGCNNFCTYCAVPYTRGRERSRKISDIISEIKYEINMGRKNIILLGQNVNNFKSSKNNTDDFTNLLVKVDIIPGDFKYNFISANPRNFTKRLVSFLITAKKWNRHLHLPLQSGNNKILKKMNRGYSVKEYCNVVSSLKSEISNLKLTTDVIVGFPGETTKQFTDSVKICKKIDFNGAFVAQYSPRPQTLAQMKFNDNVSREEKKRRWSILNKLINTRK